MIDANNVIQIPRRGKSRPEMEGIMPSGARNEKTPSYRNLGYALILLAAVMSLGTLGLMRIENFTFLEAFYMTVITISTVGFGELHELSDSGRIFIVFVIVSGMALVGYTAMTIGGIVVEGHLRSFLGGRMMRKELDRLRGHYIVCGYGRMGRIVCDELVQEGKPHVVVTDDQEDAEALRLDGRLVVHGDATDDDILVQAGVTRARGLVATVSSDIANLYITMSARELTAEENPKLYILARAADEKAIHKIKHAGANRVVSPYKIGGSRLAMALLRPTVFDYLEVVSQGGDIELGMEELPIDSGCPLAGKRLRETTLRQDYDIIVIGLLDSGGEMIFNPGPEHELRAGDKLIVLGGRSQMTRLQRDLGV